MVPSRWHSGWQFIQFGLSLPWQYTATLTREAAIN